MAEAAQNLAQQIQKQTLKNAQDFYGNSLGSLKSQLENDRSQLQELIEQLPESQEDARAQLEELVASYEAIGDSLDEVAQEQGVEDAVDQVAQQAQETVGQTTEQVQDVGASTETSDRWNRAKGATTNTAGRAWQTVGSVAGNRYAKAKSFLARRKGSSAEEADE